MVRRQPGRGEALLGCQGEREAPTVEAMLSGEEDRDIQDAENVSGIMRGAAPAHLPHRTGGFAGAAALLCWVRRSMRWQGIWIQGQRRRWMPRGKRLSVAAERAACGGCAG